MTAATLALLALALASPLLWVGLMTLAATGKLALVLVAFAVWLWRSERRRPGGDEEVTAVALASAALWLEGTLLWLTAPVAHGWHLLPPLLAVTASAASFAPGGRECRLPPGVIPPLALVLGWLLLAGLTESHRPLPLGVLSVAAPALLLWRLPALLALAHELGPARARWPRRLTAAILALMAAAGLWQARQAHRLFDALAESQAPWEVRWTPDRVDALRRVEARFAQPRGEETLRVLDALALAGTGASTEAQRAAAEVLAAAPRLPVAIAAAAHIWSRGAALEALTSRLTPSQVIGAGGLEAARSLAGALMAGDDFGRARVIHTHFGDALFAEDHPVLTPQRIGSALVAWGRPEEALTWFSGTIPAPWETAESLLWRGLALRALGRESEARTAWERALSFAPHHADIQAHLATGEAGAPARARTGLDLLPNPVAGRQLVEVTLTGVSPEALPDPLVLSAGLTLRLECGWRLTHVASESCEVRLRVGDIEMLLSTLEPTESLVSVPDLNLPDAVGARRRLGERVRSTVTFTVPEAPASALHGAQLVVAAGPGAAVPHREALELAPLASVPAFRAVDRRAGQGLSAARRMEFYGRGSHSLGLSASLQGAESALQVFDPPVRTSGLGFISALSGARELPPGHIAALVFLSDQRGALHVFPVRAGIETADIWHEYPPFQSEMRHGLAPIAWQTPRSHRGHEFPVTRYRTTLDLGEPMDLRAIRVRTLLPTTASLQVLDLIALPID